MAGFFSRLKSKDAPAKVTKANKKGGSQPVPPAVPAKPRWEDAWTRKTVEPEEVQELLRGCTLELKSKALDMPFLLLPFRPTSNPSAARTFIRNFFDRAQHMHGEVLAQELRLTEPMVLCSVAKWCWSRLPGGVVSWEAYELFRVGEQDSNMARDSFATFIPLSVDSDARTQIIFDFFDLLSAIAAHGKMNGLGGRKLSRMAGWWAFEHVDSGNGFDGGYKGWTAAADATSHLFFAYLRSLSPDSVQGLGGISTLPISLQKLVQETEYPPERPTLLQVRTTKVAMIVDSVSPTPFALLRRTNHFQYRDDDRALQEFSEYEDPVKALTDECRRVLKSISSANQSQASNSKQSTGLRDASWSRFEDIGFSGGFDGEEEEDDESNFTKRRNPQGLRTTPHSKTMNMGRPTTPSWADFLSSGFVDEAKNGPAPLLLPPDKILPPIETSRGRSSQSHHPRLESQSTLEPGELASITRFDLDDAFWWVWISSLAGEEPAERKAAFGRCALVETVIPGGRWLVMEEMVKGAAPEPDAGAYIAEKKSIFSWTKRNKGLTRRKSTGKQSDGLRPEFKTSQSVGVSKTSIGPDQHARIQAAAAQLQQKQRQQEELQKPQMRRGRGDMDNVSQKTSSVFTLQPVIMSEASPAMKWANKYDKDAIREAYLANNAAGRGLGQATMQANGNGNHSSDVTPTAELQRNPASTERDLPRVPQQDIAPAVPFKTATLPPPVSPLSPAVGYNKKEVHLSEKAAEVALPREYHPVERNVISPAPRMDPSIDITREQTRSQSTEPPRESYESRERHAKLQKKAAAGGGGGFRKMFGRNKNRDSTLPETFNSSKTQPGQLQPGGATLGRRFSGFRKKSPTTSPVVENTPVFSPAPTPVPEDDITPIQSPEPGQLRSYAPSEVTSVSRVNTGDAQEARQAFSSFDQGPLDDVPAFIPDSPEESPRQSEEAAMPPSIPTTRDQIREKASAARPDVVKEVVPVQDRWAQIRKNAAERAALRQSEEQSRGGQSAVTDNDGETSGEETIESRVARIKQRVAELTGNMENTGTPPNGASRSPIRRP